MTGTMDLDMYHTNTMFSDIYYAIVITFLAHLAHLYHVFFGHACTQTHSYLWGLV